jgi:hypothetical protein
MLVDDAVTKRLLEIAGRHCKLVLEFGGKDTNAERREAIKGEIEALRTERSSLLDCVREAAMGGCNMEKYNRLVKREDELCCQVETCQAVIQKLLDCIYEAEIKLDNHMMEEILCSVYSIEKKIQTDLLLLRVEKSFCAAQIKEATS